MFLLGQRIGNYEIQKSIGRGTFGAVYLVRDVFLEQLRAIKVPHDQSPAGREAILRESRLLAALAPPHILLPLARHEAAGRAAASVWGDVGAGGATGLGRRGPSG